ncbi:MAG TPA: TIM-barrel domain-containing protein [Bryobacteraceae bacterium]|nr:TIM-barrel domain-containing protein [Bryobacteraceae bacterium]
MRYFLAGSGKSSATISAVALVLLAACISPVWGAAANIRVVHNPDVLEVEAVAPNIVRIQLQPSGKTTPRTPVIDPAFHSANTDSVRQEKSGDLQTLTSKEMRVVVDEAALSVQVFDAAGKSLLVWKRETGGRGNRGALAVLEHDANENLYGIHGLDITNDDAGILRPSGGPVAAGVQGNAGGPFLLTKRYAVLIDSDGGAFQTRDESIRFTNPSRPDAEYFIIVGPPLKSMAGLALLSGRPPMPPKWTLGFLNSQWGSTEKEWRQLSSTYAEKGIPVSGYIFDFDWKAWGEDDYGEWRWNSTSGGGNSSPNKFPDGASGKFAADMQARGIHLAGILKPRILVNGADGKPTKAAQYATEHNLWYPNEERGNDYFTHRAAANLDFNNSETRTWFWKNLLPAFQSGMAGWWNDEADRDNKNLFGNFQFMNMARALYEGQRAVSEERAWSINRNYYIGALRYSYAEWSGDISTGFQSMAYQRKRMISTLDLGESSWSMDTGGFTGHPTAENYARWMEFGAFVPVFRVHGGNNEKRQPWVYGPIAEAAAKRAMRLRYDLMPYIYSNAREATESGIGVVRPLFWEFPQDDRCSEQTNAWMFGDALLVSPIVELGQSTHKFYLPDGTWYDYFTGKSLRGGTDISITADSTTWQDIPLYVRGGSIFATQPAAVGNDLTPSAPLVLDVFPSNARVAAFVVYDDDGHTYQYENGAYFRQEVEARRGALSTEIAVRAATGTYKPHFAMYDLRIHQASARVAADGAPLKRFATVEGFRASEDAGWVSTSDRFGAVTEVRLPTESKERNLKLTAR